MSLVRAAALLLVAVFSPLSHAQWLGIEFVPSVTPGTPNIVNMFTLNNDGSQGSPVGSTSIGNLTVPVDGFRCLPYSTFCLFLGVDEEAEQSWLYNVSAAAMADNGKLQLDGLAHNLHVLFPTGRCTPSCRT